MSKHIETKKNILLNNPWLKIKKCFKLNENIAKTHHNLRALYKTVLRMKSMALKAYIRKNCLK